MNRRRKGALAILLRSLMGRRAPNELLAEIWKVVGGGTAGRSPGSLLEVASFSLFEVTVYLAYRKRYF